MDNSTKFIEDVIQYCQGQGTSTAKQRKNAKQVLSKWLKENDKDLPTKDKTIYKSIFSVLLHYVHEVDFEMTDIILTNFLKECGLKESVLQLPALLNSFVIEVRARLFHTVKN